jgi:hypothetical protein
VRTVGRSRDQRPLPTGARRVIAPKTTQPLPRNRLHSRPRLRTIRSSAEEVLEPSSSVAAGSGQSPASTHWYSGESAGQGDDGLTQWARWPNLAESLARDERGIE